MALTLVSFDTLESVLGLKGAVVSNYPDLTVFINSVYYGIEGFLGRELESMERTETMRIRKSRIIPLKGLPISSISSITEDGDSISSDE